MVIAMFLARRNIELARRPVLCFLSLGLLYKRAYKYRADNSII